MTPIAQPYPARAGDRKIIRTQMIFLTWAFRHASGGAVGALAQAIARGLDHGVGENRIGVAPSGTGIEGRAEALREGAEERIAKEVVMLALDAVGDVAASEGPQVLGDSVKAVEALHDLGEGAEHPGAVRVQVGRGGREARGLART